MSARQISAKYLLFLTIFTYLAAYTHLAFYHETPNLWYQIIHESGQYTLVETVFFASHFIGHIPVYTCLAIYFVGCFFCLSSVDSKLKYSFVNLLKILIIFLLACFAIALLNSVEDTFAYIFQVRQRVGEYNTGGSWNLHLPSTLQMFLLIPIYQIFFLRFLSRQINLSLKGFRLIFIAFLMFFLFTYLVNYSDFSFLKLFADPRYQGHALRELATYGLTYLPLAMYFSLGEASVTVARLSPRVKLIFISLLGFFVLTLVYQLVLVLGVDLKGITQVPDFAKSNRLSIAYLLSSHYFEHVLDSIYFVLIVMLAFRGSWKLSTSRSTSK